MFHSNSVIRDSFMLVLVVMAILLSILFCISTLPAHAQSDSQIITYHVSGKEIHIKNVIRFEPGDPAAISIASDICTIQIDRLSMSDGSVILAIYRSCNNMSLDKLATFNAFTLEIIDI